MGLGVTQEAAVFDWMKIEKKGEFLNRVDAERNRRWDG